MCHADPTTFISLANTCLMKVVKLLTRLNITCVCDDLNLHWSSLS